MLLGALLFAVSRYVQADSRAASPSPASPSRQIQLSVGDLSQMAVLFQSQFGRQPTVQEFRHLVDSRVQEEILYREALAMGLDRDDTIVRRRMAQKMQFLAEDVAESQEPTGAELRSWFAKNGDRFVLPGRISFRHLYFSPDRRGKRARDDAATALAKLSGQPEETKLAATLADPYMFAEHYRDRTPEELGKDFGPQFALALVKLPTGSWQGPVESGYGWHLVYVDTVIPGRAPAFEEVEGEVKTAWLGEQKALAWEKAYREMRAKYEVVLPAIPGDESPSSSPVAVPPSPGVRAP